MTTHRRQIEQNEDEIAAQYAGMRRKFAAQDRVTQTKRKHQEGWNRAHTLAAFGTFAIVTVAIFAKPVAQALAWAQSVI